MLRNNDSSAQVNQTANPPSNTSIITVFGLDVSNQDIPWHIKYLGIFLTLNTIGNVSAFVMLMFMTTKASTNLYNSMFTKLMKAPASFFDTKPVGRWIFMDINFRNYHVSFIFVFAFV